MLTWLRPSHWWGSRYYHHHHYLYPHVCLSYAPYFHGMAGGRIAGVGSGSWECTVTGGNDPWSERDVLGMLNGAAAGEGEEVGRRLRGSGLECGKGRLTIIPGIGCWGEKVKFLLCKELFLTQTHTSKLRHIGRVILTHTTKGKLNKQSEKYKCIIRDTLVHPNRWITPTTPRTSKWTQMLLP